MDVCSITDMQTIKQNCRVCLQQSHPMISLDSTFKANADADPLLVCDILENIFSVKLNSHWGAYPGQVCPTCYNNATIAYDLKTTFKKSQYILDNFLFDLKPKGFMKSENCVLSDYHDADRSMKEEFSETPPEVVYHQKNKQNDFVILQVDNQDDIEVKEQLETNKYFTETLPKVVQEVTDDDNPDGFKVDQDAGSDNNNIATRITVNKSSQKIASKYTKIVYRCPFCKQYLSNKPSYEQHKQACQRNRLQICNRPLKIVLPKLQSCDEPTKTMLTNNDQPAKVTLKKVESREPPSKITESRSSRSLHMRTEHRNKEFFCKECNKSCSNKVNLNRHMETHTKNVLREICPECGKGFHYRGGLFYHMRIHRGERKHMCSYCGHKFVNTSCLKSHMLIHTGEKPCQCDVCGKEFRCASVLKNHKRTHSGERPHVCKYCGKGFIKAYNCRLHMAGHRGDYPCTLCRRSFIDEEVVQLHLKFKHNSKGDERNSE
ncbi:hypothetical protein NQ315_001183 [Exocentrus adspersus]|uniref:Uncharacterized protein n=1 Tax=Exocentrus adspersus TaxID=1586481 RepID=A0AAV8WF93_9CUCU|nr:hypothetical protein NQ315_001183 [Exocentrus adspersus]